MRIPIFTLMLSTIAIGTAAWAQDDYQASGNVSSDYNRDVRSSQAPGETVNTTNVNNTNTQAPGTTDDANLATTAESSEITRGYLNKEMVGLKPQVGAVAFTDQLGNTQGRAAYGFTVETNIASMVGLGGSPFYVGPETGFIFSHLGDPSSNFFGSNAETSVGAGGANMFLIPVDLKIGYNVTDRLRVGAHGGGNVVYRSIASSLQLGDSSSLPGSVWRIFPNGGGDLEYAFGQNVALMARPDVTVTPGNTIFTGTLALNIALG